MQGRVFIARAFAVETRVTCGSTRQALWPPCDGGQGSANVDTFKTYTIYSVHLLLLVN